MPTHRLISVPLPLRLYPQPRPERVEADPIGEIARAAHVSPRTLARFFQGRDWNGDGSLLDHLLIFYGAGVLPGRHPEFVRTVDLAPTLAELAGVPPTEQLDGVILRNAIR